MVLACPHTHTRRIDDFLVSSQNHRFVSPCPANKAKKHAAAASKKKTGPLVGRDFGRRRDPADRRADLLGHGGAGVREVAPSAEGPAAAGPPDTR